MSKKHRTSTGESTDDQLKRIKRLAIIAMFSDDELVEKLVLKGGNALDLVHGISTRASIDLDFSMEDAFPLDQLEDIRQRIERRLRQTYLPAGYHVLDVRLGERPEQVTPDLADFWGGYRLEFKLVASSEYESVGGEHEKARKRAVPVGPRNRRRFEIDISKYEHCSGRQTAEIDGFTVYVYTPEMLVCEKLRAICQQRPEYVQLVMKSPAPRARDFLDIHDTVTHFDLDLATSANIELLERVFAAKRVPMNMLANMDEQREFHRQDWPAVRETVRPGVRLRDFDYYVDFVADMGRRLEALRHE